MKTMLRWGRVCSALIVALAWLAATRTAQADGIVVYGDPTRNWQLSGERHQYAVVSWRAGREDLLLQVALNPTVSGNSVKSLIWLVPIPAPASQVQVQILPGFPSFSGDDAKFAVGMQARDALAVIMSTQIWPTPVTGVILSLKGEAPARSIAQQKLEHDGIALQVLTAESAEAVVKHVRTLGADLPASATDSLQGYLGADHCIIAYQIVDPAALRRAQGERGLGIAVRFPSSKGFFPLKISAALPGDQTEVSVTALGLMKPIGSANGLKTSYYVGWLQAGWEVRQALGLPLAESPAQDPAFTEFRLTGKPSALVGDLSFEPGAPAIATFSVAWLTHPPRASLRWALGAVVLVLLSTLSSIAAVSVWPREARPKLRWLAWVGVLHCGTLILPTLAAVRRARRLGVPRARALAFVACSSALLTLVLAALMFIARSTFSPHQ